MNKRFLLPIVIVSFVAILVLGLKYSNQFWPFRIVHDQIANPIGAELTHVKNAIYDQIRFLGSITSVGKENKQLRQTELELRQQLASLKEVARENELLRNQLQFNARLNLDLVPARVVSVEPNNTRHFITIDRGSSSGVKKGQAVLSSGVLVGVIDEVNDYSAKVFLVSDPDFRLRAVGQDGRAQGIVRGQIGQGYIFEKIAQGELVSQNEQVVTAGSGLVPQGILIGTVESISKADNAVFTSANLKPLVDLNSLELVFVATGLRQ